MRIAWSFVKRTSRFIPTVGFFTFLHLHQNHTNTMSRPSTLALYWHLNSKEVPTIAQTLKLYANGQPIQHTRKGRNQYKTQPWRETYSYCSIPFRLPHDICLCTYNTYPTLFYDMILSTLYSLQPILGIINFILIFKNSSYIFHVRFFPNLELTLQLV